jgi:hypothetical protein
MGKRTKKIVRNLVFSCGCVTTKRLSRRSCTATASWQDYCPPEATGYPQTGQEFIGLTNRIVVKSAPSAHPFDHCSLAVGSFIEEDMSLYIVFCFPDFRFPAVAQLTPVAFYGLKIAEGEGRNHVANCTHHRVSLNSSSHTGEFVTVLYGNCLHHRLLEREDDQTWPCTAAFLLQ